MYAEHSDPDLFRRPPDINNAVWRYMDFAKFASMLAESKLYFPTLSQLADPFEGSFSEATRQSRVRAIKGAISGPGMSDPQADAEAQRVSALLGEAIRVARPLTAVSCWHLSGIESAAMWKVYAAERQGIAVRSTFERLTKSFRLHKEHNIYVGLVNYVDFLEANMPRESYCCSDVQTPQLFL